MHENKPSTGANGARRLSLLLALGALATAATATAAEPAAAATPASQPSAQARCSGEVRATRIASRDRAPFVKPLQRSIVAASCSARSEVIEASASIRSLCELRCRLRR